MFNRGLKKENEELKEEIESLKKSNNVITDEYCSLLKRYNNEKDKNKDIFTYNDAIEVIDARLKYMEEKYNEVKGSGLTEVTQRYYYQKTELEKILWVLLEKSQRKNEKITKDIFKKLVISDD